MHHTPSLLIALVASLAACKSPAPTSVPASAPTARPTPALHGHRGARGLRPENTLPAFERALELGVDVLEMDLHLSSDGEVVVWHDPYVRNTKCRAKGPLTAPVQPADAPTSWSRERQTLDDVIDPDELPALHPALAIANQTAAQLRRLRCDRNPDPERFATQTQSDDEDYGIVTLSEVFDFVASYSDDERRPEQLREHARAVRFNVELKRVPHLPGFIADRFDGVNAAAFERALLATIDAHNMRQRVIVQSFDHRSLWAFHALAPDVRLAALQRAREPVPDFIELRKRGATIWSPDARAVTAARVDEAHAAGLTVVPWTVNDPKRGAELIAMDIDGIITDRPDVVRTTSKE